MAPQLTDGKPYRCLVCESTDRTGVVAWLSNKRCLKRDFGLAPGRAVAVLYPLCKACGAPCQEPGSPLASEVEQAIVAHLRAQGLI